MTLCHQWSTRKLIIFSDFVFGKVLTDQPTLVNVFNTTNAQVLMTLSIFFIGYALGQLLWGTASDYFGRRKMMLISLYCYVVIAFLLSRAANINQFSILICVLGFFAAAHTSIGNALLKDIFGMKHVAKAIAYVGIAMAVAPIIGSHFLVWFGWPSIFIALTSLAIFLIIGFWFFVPETEQNKQKPDEPNEPLIKVIIDILKHKQYLAFVLSLGLVFGAFFA